VIVVYPHTSNWDFVIGYLARLASAFPVQFVGKHTLFRWPFGGLLRRMGGIPVNRADPAGLLERLAGELARSDRLWLALAPEGTRSYTDHWKSGFYRLALSANVPIGLAFIDYRARTVGLTTYLSLSGDEEADLARIRAVYADKIGKHPGQASDIRFRPAQRR
jgi:1-acyl-sn-glycerol-3-phosphate acyltransferase